MGPSAGDRLNGDTIDGDESLRVEHVGGTAGNETLNVSAFGVTQTFFGVRSIIADGGAGNDMLVVAPGVLADADLSGGPGKDTLTYLGSGSATLRGDDGDDTLTTGVGTTTMIDDSGRNSFHGGAGTATLVIGGASYYSLTDNQITVDSFVSNLDGIRDVQLTGTEGNDRLDVSAWSGNLSFDGLDGSDSVTVATGGGGVTNVLHSGAVGQARLNVMATEGNDTMSISGDRITADGDMVVYPRTIESLTVDGAGGDDSFVLLDTVDGEIHINGDDGNDTLLVLGSRGFSRTLFDGGSGNDNVSVLGGSDTAIRGGLVLEGGSGVNHLDVNLAGNLSNLIQAAGFAGDTAVRVGGSVQHALVARSGTFQQITVAGSLDTLGSVVAGDIASLMIGGELRGTVAVGGTLGSLVVAGATPGIISAGDVGTVQALNAKGTLILRISEAGVTRRIEATPVAPGNSHLDGVKFSYIYDSTGTGDPRLQLHVVNAAPATTKFDLALATDSSANFTLARLDSTGASGLRQLRVDGDIGERVQDSRRCRVAARSSAACCRAGPHGGRFGAGSWGAGCGDGRADWSGGQVDSGQPCGQQAGVLDPASRNADRSPRRHSPPGRSDRQARGAVPGQRP